MRPRHRLYLALGLILFFGILILNLAPQNDLEPSTLPVAAFDPGVELHRLIDHHPRAQVRDRLPALIKSGIVVLNYEHELAGPGSISAILLVRFRELGDRIVLNVSDAYLLDESYSVKHKQCTVWHEYQHLDQLLTGRYPLWTFRLTPREAELLTEELVELYYNAEIEAYTAECELARELGNSQDSGICRAYDRAGVPGLRRAVAETYAALPHYEKFREFMLGLADRSPGAQPTDPRFIARNHIGGTQ